jgi:hypothetical protein|tara:strand:+ start:1310 stop:1618 length:309 start_codon:yes stop_codon:yes gene_type:complete
MDKRYTSIARDVEGKAVALSSLSESLHFAQQFKLTFYSKKDEMITTRKGFFDDKCKVWETKSGKIAITYVCLNDDGSIKGYRTATDIFEISALSPITRKEIN